MDITTGVPLSDRVTMRLGGEARFFVEISDVNEIQAIVNRAREQNLSFYILGEGSNTIVRDEGFDGIVIRNKIPGFKIIKDTASHTVIKIGAGEHWDHVVKRTVDLNLTGIECLSAIPGTAGAAPVQNIGAYGQEISDTLLELEAFDCKTDQLVTISNEACEFSYRNSAFRDHEFGRYIITSITLTLYKALPKPPFYKAVQDYIDSHGITNITPKTLRDIVTDIRKDKLPDPKIKPNNGSFFKNALVEEWQLNIIRGEYPDVPVYDMPNNMYKIPTGWLIEQTGLKGEVLHGIRINDKNALVLINESAKSYNDLALARNQIVTAVHDKFQIVIEQEPLEMVSATTIAINN